MIRVERLSKSFGALAAVHELSFTAERNRVTSIIGPNGAGKSTVFNLVTGAIPADGGSVHLGERTITGLRPYEVASLGVARSFQITNLFFESSVFENVRLACQALESRRGFLRRLSRCERPRERALHLLGEFGLDELAGEQASNLSHGDQRRLEVAVCMASRPQVLMLDEPTQGMSPSETAETDALIRSLAGRTTVLLVEHDVELVMGVSDHVIVMHQGMKLFEGTPEQVRGSSAVREAYLGGGHGTA